MCGMRNSNLLNGIFETELVSFLQNSFLNSILLCCYCFAEMSRYFSGNFMANYSAHFLAYRVIYFDFEIKTNNFMGIGLNFLTVIKSKEEELSENRGIENDSKLKICDRKIGFFHAIPEWIENLICGKVRAQFRLPLKRFSAT